MYVKCPPPSASNHNHRSTTRSLQTAEPHRRRCLPGSVASCPTHPPRPGGPCLSRVGTANTCPERRQRHLALTFKNVVDMKIIETRNGNRKQLNRKPMQQQACGLGCVGPNIEPTKFARSSINLGRGFIDEPQLHLIGLAQVKVRVQNGRTARTSPWLNFGLPALIY